MTKPARSILLIASLVLVLVVAAVIAVLAFSPGDSHFAPGSPEAVFQQYLNTYQSRDFNSAYGFFSSQAQKQLTADEYALSARSFGNVSFDDNQRILIGRVEHRDSAVILHLTIENTFGSGLDLNRSSYDRPIPMVQEKGTWKIDELLLGINSVPVTPTK